MTKLISLDPRPQSLQVEAEKLAVLRDQGWYLLGVEVSVPALAALLDNNIDPQHSEGRSDLAAIEVAAKKDRFLPDTAYCVIRPDLDCLGAIALLEGKPVLPELIQAIAEADKFASGEWQPLKTPFDKGFTTSQLGGMNTLLRDRKYFSVPLEEKYEIVCQWLATGTTPEHLEADYHNFRFQVLEALETGATKIEQYEGFVFIQSELEAAPAIGYCYSPVVVAYNPNLGVSKLIKEFSEEELRLLHAALHEQDDHPAYLLNVNYRDWQPLHDKLGNLIGISYKTKKWSVCQYNDGTNRIDMEGLKLALKSAGETGVGGSSTFIGSTQRVDCLVDVGEVTNIVRKYIICKFDIEGWDSRATPEQREKDLDGAWGEYPEALREFLAKPHPKHEIISRLLNHECATGFQHDLQHLIPV